jgi:hypothetical protein
MSSIAWIPFFVSILLGLGIFFIPIFSGKLAHFTFGFLLLTNLASLFVQEKSRRLNALIGLVVGYGLTFLCSVVYVFVTPNENDMVGFEIILFGIPIGVIAATMVASIFASVVKPAPHI